MADFEQERASSAGFERHSSPCQIFRLVRHRSVGSTLPAAFLVQAYVDDHVLTATAETAKDAFAKAVEWHIVGKLTDVSIKVGASTYTIPEFSLMMALREMANTIQNCSLSEDAGEEVRAGDAAKGTVPARG